MFIIGACPLCKKESERRCRCGKVKEVKPCCESDFSCEIVCGKSFSCGKHICEKVFKRKQRRITKSIVASF